MEKETDIIYDLEQEKPEELQQPSESAETEETSLSEMNSTSDNTVASGDISDQSDSSGMSEEKEEQSPSPISEAENEIASMVKEIGAERVLDIIRGNRNSAIEQIMSEMGSAADHSLQSGVSIGCSCNSIFDLAALA